MLLGTVVYSLGEGWSVGDGRYFAFCTVTTQSIADPNLTLTHEWLKDFTIIYTLAGLGILVEFGRELGARRGRALSNRQDLGPAGVDLVGAGGGWSRGPRLGADRRPGYPKPYVGGPDRAACLQLGDHPIGPGAAAVRVTNSPVHKP